MQNFRCQGEATRLFENKRAVDCAVFDTDDDTSQGIQFTPSRLLSVNQNRRVEEGTAVFSDTTRGVKSYLVVMKTLYFNSKQQQEQAIREFTFHQALQHPNLVRCLHTLQEGSELKIFLEHCKYYDLDHYTGMFTAYIAGRLVAQLLSVLHYLHTLPYSSLFFVHGDVKRSNCFLGQDQEQKLGDFGSTHFQRYDAASLQQVTMENQHGVTRSYLPYFRDSTPVVSQCTDIWAAILVSISILGDLTSFFQFTNSTSLSHYLQNYHADLVDALSGHDPRYAEFLPYFSTDEAIEAYYSPRFTDHDTVRARLKTFMCLPPVRSFLSMTPLFSSLANQEIPFSIHEETASGFTKLHREYTEKTLLTLAAAQTGTEPSSPLGSGGSKKIVSRTVYFTSDHATVHSDPFVMSLCGEIEAMNLCPKLLDWLIRLGLKYIESSEEFKAIWSSMYTELITITAGKSMFSEVNCSLIQHDSLISDSFGREYTSCFQLSDEFDLIQIALSSAGVQNASYLWSLIMDYVILCPEPQENLFGRELCTQLEVSDTGRKIQPEKEIALGQTYATRGGASDANIIYAGGTEPEGNCVTKGGR